MLLRFTKMHGLGNDFVVLDLITQNFSPSIEQIKFIADRHLGIGCDQVLIVEVPENPEVDFKYRIFNQDGSEVEQCGNGVRCFAKFVTDQKLTGKTRISVETSSGIVEVNLTNNKQVVVNMGKPILTPKKIPFNASKQAETYPLQVNDHQLEISAVSMGNPHCVTLVDDIATDLVQTLGPVIESHEDFPQRVNAGFMEIVNTKEVNLRVYERGVGETRACGTGACAAVVAGQLRGLLEQQVTVNLPGGSLVIEWRGKGHPVMMTGPATTVYDGHIHL